MKLIEADTNLTRFLCNIDTALSVSAFFFRVSGTNDAGETLTKGNIGRVKYRVRNTTLVDASFEMLHHMGNILFGALPAVSTIADAFEFGIVIPRFWNDNNVEFIEKEDNAVFEITFDSAFDSAVASGLVELYAIEAEGIQSYNMKLIQHGESYGGAGTFPETYSQENILQAFFSDLVGGVNTLNTTTIGRVAFALGDQKGEGSVGAFLSWTNIIDKLETAIDLCADLVAAEGDITARLNDKLDVSWEVTAASYPQILMLSALFNPNKLKLTQNLYRHRLYRKLQEAQIKEKTRTLEVIKSMPALAPRRF